MKIKAIHKENGKITKYKLDDGTVVTKKKCIQLIKKGKIEDYNVGFNRSQTEFIRANRLPKDSKKKITKIENLPLF